MYNINFIISIIINIICKQFHKYYFNFLIKMNPIEKNKSKSTI